jgi:outer membrane protein OmpA-like peptidoglycan-associated protein
MTLGTDFMKKRYPFYLLLLLTAALTGCSSDMMCRSGSQSACYRSRNTYQRELHNRRVQVIQYVGSTRIILPADVLFQPSSAHFRAHTRLTLNTVAALIKTYPHPKITVSGYTDNVSAPKRNQQLAKAQARQVAGFLWTKRIPLARRKGQGDQNPIASNRSVAGMSNNRRVEIVLRNVCNDDQE